MTDKASARGLREHKTPGLDARPGRYRWPDGCELTVEHIHGGYNAPTIYRMSDRHVGGTKVLPEQVNCAFPKCPKDGSESVTVSVGGWTRDLSTYTLPTIIEARFCSEHGAVFRDAANAGR